MKVTVCQIDCRPDHLNEALEGLAAHVAKEASDFLLVPEMCFSEWLAADPVPDASQWQKAVASHETHIAGLSSLNAKAVMGTRPIILPHGSRRNEAFVWTEETGAAPVHQKYYLPDEEGYYEHTWYERGPGTFDIARALGMRIGVQICTEMWFFEWARHYAASRADLLCVPRATPHGSTRKWLAGGQTAAVCSGAYCLSSNLWAPEGYKVNCGGLGWGGGPEGKRLGGNSPEAPYATLGIGLAFSPARKTTHPRPLP